MPCDLCDYPKTRTGRRKKATNKNKQMNKKKKQHNSNLKPNKPKTNHHQPKRKKIKNQTGASACFFLVGKRHLLRTSERMVLWSKASTYASYSHSKCKHLLYSFRVNTVGEKRSEEAGEKKPPGPVLQLTNQISSVSPVPLLWAEF